MTLYQSPEQIKTLQAELEKHKAEKQDLEIMLQIAIEHGDAIDEALLKEHNSFFQQVLAFQDEKDDLQISLETIVEHSSIIEDELLSARQFLERQVERRTKELAEKNTLLQHEVQERKRIEELQRNHLIFIQTLLDNLPSSVYYKDLQGYYLGCNHAFERMVGLSEEDIKGKQAFDIFPTEVAQKLYEKDLALYQEGGEQVYETNLRYANNTMHDILIHKTTFRNSEGKTAGLIGVLIDITERKRAEEKLRLAASVFQGSNEGILMTDANNKIISVNQAYITLTGYTTEETLGRNPNMLASGKHGQSFYANMWKSLSEAGRWSGEIWNRRKNKELFLAWLSISSVKDEQGRITNYIAIFTDITDKKISEERLYHLSHYDALTDLANRVLLQDRLVQAIKRASRSNEFIALLTIDIDHFKSINDAFGHATGDELLQLVSKRLIEVVGELTDTIARLGGDEFSILLTDLVPDNTGLRSVSHLAGEILTKMKPPFMLAGQEIFITVSIGIAVYPQDGDSTANLLKNADAALYGAKANGRDNYSFFTKTMNIAAHKRLSMQNSLRRAIERNEFLLYYQPQVNPYTQEVIGLEALIRWRHPEMGMVSPVEFIPLSEETGLIIPIGEWVLQEACRQNKQWQMAGYRPMSIAVNLSVLQFYHENLIESIKNALQAVDLSPHYLELEITESLAMRSVEETLSVLNNLKTLGTEIAIDDFGTGYSSLSYLKQFPVDTLKIDSSFITDIATPKGAALVSVIIKMAQSLGMKVVAEGVQMPEQLEFLSTHSCDLIQGYLFCPPLPPQEIVNHLPKATPDIN